MSTPMEPSRPLTIVKTPPVAGAFVPVLILALSMVAWFGFQATQLRAERDAMRDAMVKQDKPLEDSKKLRETLETILRRTSQLADSGNPNARLVVDELKKRGVTFNANPTAPTSPAPAP